MQDICGIVNGLGKGSSEFLSAWRLAIMEHVEKVKHTGGCHCGEVRFEVWAPKDVSVWDCKYANLFNHSVPSFTLNVTALCSCSICHMKGTQFFVVSDTDFKILQVNIILFIVALSFSA